MTAPAASRGGCRTMPHRETTDIAQFLQQPALAAMSESLRMLTARGELRRYRKGTVIIVEGDYGDSIYIILQGRLRAYSTGTNDREITYGIYGPGEYLGEMSLDGGPRSASVITLETSVCSTVTRHTLQRFIAEHPQFAFELLSKVIRRARAATLSAKQLALNDVYGRLKWLLDSLAEPNPTGARVIHERLTHHDLASRLGCSREMVSRLMKDLEQGGYVLPPDRGGLRITLPGPLPARW
jgi:CRP/FNR family transcriptional regulator, cyclic AMP receptor protein